MATKPLCSISNCGKTVIAGGLCNAHYRRKRRHGDPNAGGALRHLMSAVCAVDGCGNPRKSNGFCQRHYQQFRRTGAPLVHQMEAERIQWLREHIAYDGEECLTWPFASLNNGYPAVRFKGGVSTASRVMCTLVHGEPPHHEMEAAHSCGRGHEGCVHPRHLSWKTKEGNEADRITHGTTNRGERCGSAKLTRDDVQAIRSLDGTASRTAIAAQFGVSRQTVNDIIHRRRWSWLD